MHVIFESTERGEFASASRTIKYFFGPEGMAAAVAADAPPRDAGDGEAAEE